MMKKNATRIDLILQREGPSARHNRVVRIMRENGWRAKVAQKHKATKWVLMDMGNVSADNLKNHFDWS